MSLLERVSVTLIGGDHVPPLEVEGYALRGAPGLAVTPSRTGEKTTSLTYYTVTHIASGAHVGGQYTPFNAINLMADLHTLDADWMLSKEALNTSFRVFRRAVNEIVNRYETAGDDED